MKLGSQPWFKSHIYILINSKKQANMKYSKEFQFQGGNIIKHGRESECHCYNSDYHVNCRIETWYHLSDNGL